jgi:hypothetical protein
LYVPEHEFSARRIATLTLVNLRASALLQIQGVLKMTAQGFSWKKAGGGKSVDINKNGEAAAIASFVAPVTRVVRASCADITALFWTKMAPGCQLSIRRTEGVTVNLLGFRDKVLPAPLDTTAYLLPVVALRAPSTCG